MSTGTGVARTVVVAVALVLQLGAAPPPPPPDSIDTSFELVGGSLAISAPVGPVSGGTASSSPGAHVIGPFPLGEVTVTDTRDLAISGEWVASVESTDFTSATSSVPASAVSYTPPSATRTGLVSIVVTPTPASDLTTSRPVQTATRVVGDNEATWNPDLTITIPAGAPAGVYSAILTHSVL